MHSIRHSRSILLTREQWNIALFAVHVLLSSTSLYKLINCIVSVERYFFMQFISVVHPNVSRNIHYTSVDSENDDDWSFNICSFAWIRKPFTWSFRMISKSCIYIFTHKYNWQWMCAHDWHLRMKWSMLKLLWIEGKMPFTARMRYACACQNQNALYVATQEKKKKEGMINTKYGTIQRAHWEPNTGCSSTFDHTVRTCRVHCANNNSCRAIL